MLTIVVCEDNLTWLKWLGKTITKTIDDYNKECEIELFDNVEDLLEYSMVRKPDIAYLDIQIGKGNGLKAAKRLEMINKNALVIYISAYEDYYYEALQTAPFRYIKKTGSYNEDEVEVKKTLWEAVEWLSSDYYLYRFSGREYMLDLTKIKYIYSRHREIHFVGDEEQRYFYGKLDDVERELLNKDKLFVRINKSTIINIRYMQHMSLRSVMVDEQNFNISSKHKENFLDIVQKFT